MNQQKKDTFLSAPQADGSSLDAERIAEEVHTWLQSLGCAKEVGDQLIRQYAMAVGRWEQAEKALSKFGLIAKKNGAATESPYVAIAERYQKQSMELWAKINRVVRLRGGTPKPDAHIVQKRKGVMPDGSYYKRTSYGSGHAACAVCQ